MKVKTINKTLCKVFDDLISSIKDDKVKSLMSNNTIITGGSIASMLLGEKVNDYDIYFMNEETLKAVMEYYASVFNKHNPHIPDISVIKDKKNIRYIFGLGGKGIVIGNKAKGGKKYHPMAFTSNSITLTADIQLVTRFYGSIESIHSTYDFAHVRNYWSSDKRKVSLDTEALECLLTKELRYKGSLYPLCSIIRTRKFLKRGFTCNAAQYLKMAMQLNDLDLGDRDVLADQLTGVDIVYFNAFLNSISEKTKTDPNFTITTQYVEEVIDKIFDESDESDEDNMLTSEPESVTLSNGTTYTIKPSASGK